MSLIQAIREATNVTRSVKKHSATFGNQDVYNRMFNKGRAAVSGVKQNVSGGSMATKGTKSFVRGLKKLSDF